MTKKNRERPLVSEGGELTQEEERRQLRLHLRRILKAGIHAIEVAERKFAEEPGTEHEWINPNPKVKAKEKATGDATRTRSKLRFRKKNPENISPEDLRALITNLRDIMTPTVQAAKALHAVIQHERQRELEDDEIDVAALLNGQPLQRPKPPKAEHVEQNHEARMLGALLPQGEETAEEALEGSRTPATPRYRVLGGVDE